MQYTWETSEMHTKFWLHSFKGILLGRPRCRWDDDTKRNLMGALWKSVDWTDLAQDRDWWQALVNTIMKKGS
jgi:hypothetical protein